MTERFAWKPHYVCGEETVDRQHRQLVQLANLLIDAIDRRQGEAVVADALRALQHYTREHFEDEEAFFESIGSPLLAEHVEQHAELRREVDSFVADERMGFIALGEQVALWVETRLVHHMTVEDQAALHAAPGH